MRLGQREKALDWYQKAGLSSAEMGELRTRRLPFVSGKIEGRITIDGNPARGVRVGILTWKVLEDWIFENILTRRDRFPHRYVAAGTTTGQNGEFSLEYLVEGEYALAIMAGTALISTDSQEIHIFNSPGKIVLNKQSPVVQTGQIEITTSNQ